MTIPYLIGQPGMGAIRAAAHRHVFLGTDRAFLPGGWSTGIDGTLARDADAGQPGTLRPGLLMGKVTATGLYANCVIGVTTGAYTSGGTTLTFATLPQSVEFVRRLTAAGTATAKVIGPPTANGTLAVTSMTWSAVDVTTGIITCSSLGVDKVSGSLITAADGSQTPMSFIDDFEYGKQVVDMNGNSVAQVPWPLIPVAGVVDGPQLLPWPSDTSIQAWIMQNLNDDASGGRTGRGKFIFQNLY